METNISSSKLPLTLAQSLAELESLLKEKHPRMPTLLAEIHSTLRKQPENVVLLSEEEISVIISGLEIQTNVKLATTTSKKAASSGSTTRLKNVSVDDI